MADTLQNVILPRATWVDLYAATGITIGVKLELQNLTESAVRVASKATVPLADTGFRTVPTGFTATNEAGDAGAWAWASFGGAVNVKVSA